jgi:predicted anti-sigma-YlaC factor YlaD
MMTCDEVTHYLSEYIDHELDEHLAEQAREHLSVCPMCSALLDSTQRVILMYRQRGQQKHISTERQQALYKQLADTFLRGDDTTQE